MNDILSHSIGLDGVDNARELGGYVMQDGRTVKSGVLLRTGKLLGATAQDISKLRDIYKVEKVLDMRTTVEIAQEPDVQIDGAENIHIGVIDESVASEDAAAMTAIYAKGENLLQSFIDMISAGRFIGNMYKSVLTSKHMQRECRRFFDELLTADGAVLWHCTGGKDRTGMTAVFLLTVLGADKATALADFALTNEYYKAKIDFTVAAVKKITDDELTIKTIAGLIGVNVDFMDEIYSMTEAKCGSMLEFIKSEIGVTDDEILILKEKYLN